MGPIRAAGRLPLPSRLSGMHRLRDRRGAVDASANSSWTGLSVISTQAHRFRGCDDDYILRNPFFVKDACEAIENYYFG